MTLDHNADGIVVLTGAATRIPDAIELLAAEPRQTAADQRRAPRHQHPRRSRALTPLYDNYFACCIDLDRSALNTFGNALETKRWAREHNFNSLIVVTSNWHMPRAMAEVAHQLPDVALIGLSGRFRTGEGRPVVVEPGHGAGLCCRNISNSCSRNVAHAARSGDGVVKDKQA